MLNVRQPGRGERVDPAKMPPAGSYPEYGFLASYGNSLRRQRQIAQGHLDHGEKFEWNPERDGEYDRIHHRPGQGFRGFITQGEVDHEGGTGFEVGPEKAEEFDRAHHRPGEGTRKYDEYGELDHMKGGALETDERPGEYDRIHHRPGQGHRGYNADGELDHEGATGFVVGDEKAVEFDRAHHRPGQGTRGYSAAGELDHVKPGAAQQLVGDEQLRPEQRTGHRKYIAEGHSEQNAPEGYLPADQGYILPGGRPAGYPGPVHKSRMDELRAKGIDHLTHEEFIEFKRLQASFGSIKSSARRAGSPTHKSHRMKGALQWDDEGPGDAPAGPAQGRRVLQPPGGLSTMAAQPGAFHDEAMSPRSPSPAGKRLFHGFQGGVLFRGEGWHQNREAELRSGGDWSTR